MKLDGVKKAEVDWKKGKVTADYDPRKVTVSQMVQAVNQSGVFKVKAAGNLAERKSGREEGDKKQSPR